MPHSMIHGNACFVYFNKIWDIPSHDLCQDCHARAGSQTTKYALSPNPILHDYKTRLNSRI